MLIKCSAIFSMGLRMFKVLDSSFMMTLKIVTALMRIEAAKVEVNNIKLDPPVLESLQQEARLESTHFSTQIEGNRLTLKQVEDVLLESKSIARRARDEAEVRGYFAALDALRELADKKVKITEQIIKMFHALVESGGRINVKPTPYRDGQNVIRDGFSGKIVYMPPEAKDVPALMKQLVAWINNSDLPVPIIASIAHYQFVTIHPYYDGNGRVARLLATVILHVEGYGLKGIYSLDEYYARDLSGYYDALSVGPSHNYYMGRAETDITNWVQYFCKGVALSFEAVQGYARVQQVKHRPDQSRFLRKLDDKQRQAIELFRNYEIVTAQQIGALFGFKPRTSSNLCKKWVEQGFIEIVDPSRKGRRYKLASDYFPLLA